MIAFVLNAIVPFFAVYNLPTNDAQASELSSVFGEKILICTSDGFKWISLKDLQNGKDLPKHNSRYKCALCYVAHKTDKKLAASEVVASFIQPYVVTYKFPPRSEHITHQSFDSTAHPRAPPYLA